MTGTIKYVKFGVTGEAFGHIIPEGKTAKDKDVQPFWHEEEVREGCRIAGQNFRVPVKCEEVEYELVPNASLLRVLWVRPLNKTSYAPPTPNIPRPASTNGPRPVPRKGTYGD